VLASPPNVGDLRARLVKPANLARRPRRKRRPHPPDADEGGET